MNIGKDKRHPRYKCDKCGGEIYYIPRKGFEGLNKYYKQARHDYTCKKDFDLCESCERDFRSWLNTKETLPILEERIKKFPRYVKKEV